MVRKNSVRALKCRLTGVLHQATVALANPEVADKLGFCLPSFDSDVRHFSVVLTTAFVVVRSSQNCITLQGSHSSQATVRLNVAVNITQGVRDDGLSRKPTSADSITGTSAAPHKGIFGTIPSALLCTLARPHGRTPRPRPRSVVRGLDSRRRGASDVRNRSLKTSQRPWIPPDHISR